MGAAQENPSTPSQFGFRIYKLIKDGPLSKGGAKEITDFIIPPIEILNQKNSFNDWILSLADKTITIKLYSLLYRGFKYIEIKTNSVGSKEGILGAAVKYENFENADKNLLHVTSVVENSFAKNKLGLIPYEDFIIAAKIKNTPIISLNKEGYNPLEILNIIISSNNGNDITFFIYNLKNGPRVVETKLEKDDNSDKLTLGCDVAYGALHEFPMIEIEKDSKELKKPKENITKETEKKEETDIKEININNGDEINGNNLAIKKDDNENINISKKEEENNNEVIEEDII